MTCIDETTHLVTCFPTKIHLLFSFWHLGPMRPNKNCRWREYFTSSRRGIGSSFQLAKIASRLSVIDCDVAIAQSWPKRIKFNLLLHRAATKAPRLLRTCWRIKDENAMESCSFWTVTRTVKRSSFKFKSSQSDRTANTAPHQQYSMNKWPISGRSLSWSHWIINRFRWIQVDPASKDQSISLYIFRFYEVKGEPSSPR